MDSVKLLGVRIDKANLTQAVVVVDDWLGPKGDSKLKKTIFTPNFEFLIDAQKDYGFREVLNSSDLNIPDSARFGWLESQLALKDKSSHPSTSFISFVSSTTLHLLHWFAFPFADHSFPNTTGVELVEALCKLSAQNGYSVAFVGGAKTACAKAATVMVSRYPGLNLTFADPSGQVSLDGKIDDLPTIPPTDIVFVAFGHRKQEKWIERYKNQLEGRVYMGVGGTFDYLSGQVFRAPAIWRQLGLEWLFRLLLQPWRLKRQLKIVGFIFKLI